ncbi:MAG: manganese ion homeostasis (Fr) [Lasallia pustulata]|uniref:Manganese ion homeostasis (Fr) n=1 Tax=Lasallia pustulata TaxID=136370 RepID=A0A5M8PZR5_9LECA|nr:MAG: manganese ion homeostasis (Fr) [Lasallia pustulata]
MTSPHYAPKHSSRNHFEQPAGLMQRLLGAIHWHAFHSASHRRRDRTGNTHSAWGLRHIAKVPLALILLWVIVLWWGERSVFRYSIAACDWDTWERWPEDATPHHVVLIADPQLVDPHTYPGRPWPLSTLTVRYTDLYLRRSFSLLNKALHPDTVFFLGDLFDGGREWATRGSESPEPRYKKYGEDFWLQEYGRFGRIFFRNWAHHRDHQRHTQQNRKIITGLPGNHDLGLGIGIQRPVRARFNAYFGEGNAINIIGNHTFVSVDTLSLSAKGQLDPTTGRQGIGYDEDPNADIWKPVEEFLNTVQEKKARLLARELHLRAGSPEYPPQERTAVGLYTAAARSPPTHDPAMNSLPTILLTHVPLYRVEGTPCGPLRERHPPTANHGLPLASDPPNAIPIQSGYQYQNVLTPALSHELIAKIGHVQHVFSGDDHDYCDVVHRGYTATGGGVREITVKSMSWAMGVRRPGFLMVSLWHPVDARGSPLAAPAATTLQTHLCLLPDQLGVFVRYALLLAVTLAALVVRAVAIGFAAPTAISASPHPRPRPLLPLSVSPARAATPTLAHASHTSLAARPSAGRPRSASAAPSSFPEAKPVLTNPLVDRFERFAEGSGRVRDGRRGWGEGAGMEWMSGRSGDGGEGGRVGREVAWGFGG